MSKLQYALENGQFAITAEMAPPKGCDFTEQVETALLLKEKVHGINVTDMQSASMKATSLGLCIKLKQAGCEPIIQMTGRDRSRMVIMAEMLSAYAFGIDTMLALTGDHPTVGDIPQSKPVYDLDSVGILNMLSTMEVTGRDCGGNPLAGNVVDKDSGEITDKSATPVFYKGACVTPVYEPMFLQINKLKQKVDAGAKYIQTQGIFDLESLKRFLDAVDKADIHVPIMAGIIPLKSAGMAKFMNERVPGIAVPQDQIDALAAAKDGGRKPSELGIELAAQLIGQIRQENLCAGVHIMAIGAEKNVPTILAKAGIE